MANHPTDSQEQPFPDRPYPKPKTSYDAGKETTPSPSPTQPTQPTKNEKRTTFTFSSLQIRKVTNLLKNRNKNSLQML